MYIKHSKLFLQLGIWSVVFVFAFTGSFVCIGTACEYGDASNIPMFLFMAAVCIFLMYFYFRTFVYLGRFTALDKILKNDDDGLVPRDEMAKYLNMRRDKFDKLIRYGERKKILINLVIDVEHDRFVLTDKHKPSEGIKDRPFIGMSCPGCASPLKIRAGASGHCPICGRQVTAPNIVSE